MNSEKSIELMLSQGMGNEVLIPLNHLCTAIVDCEHKTAPIDTVGIPSVRTTNIKNGRIDFESCNRISEETYILWTQRIKPEPGDLILAREAPVGEVGIIPQGIKVCLGQRTVLIRPNPEYLEPRYLLYFLLTPEMRHEMRCRAEGSTVSHLNMSDIRALEIPEPPSLDIQRTIASILGSLDDKIEVNRQMNNTLEAIGQAIFKHWFVDFEFPNEEGKPYKSSGGEMEETELGEVPVGWKVKSINEVAEVIKGRSYRSVDLSESTTALVTLKSIERGGGYRRDGLKPFIGEYKPEQVVIPGEMVISYTDVTQAAEVIGRPAIVRSDPTFDTLVASLDLAIIRPKISHLGIPYLYLLFMTDDFQNHIYGHTNGTTVLHLDKNGVPSYNFALPTIPILDKFNEISIRIYEKIENNSQQNRTLATMRDALLPKLMSGEMRVK